MNGIARALAELHDAEAALGRAFREVARRQAHDHGTRYPCRAFSAQCDERARSVREFARRYDTDLLAAQDRTEHPADGAEHPADGPGPVKRPFSGDTGRGPAPGLLLLGDLTGLFLQAQAAEVLWLLVGQGALAVRDRTLVDGAAGLHAEIGTQIKWLRTRLKDAAPQALTSAPDAVPVPDSSSAS